MPLFSRKNKTEELAKAVAAELAKAPYGGAGASGPYGGSMPQSLMGTPMYNQAGYANIVPAEPTGGQGLAQARGMIAQSLDRPGSAFGSILGPAAPLLPSPIDPLLPDTGRAEPRRYEYQVAQNLNLNLQEVPWNVLKSLANGVDIIARAITIRTSGLTKMDWSFTLSNDAITNIMAEQNVSHAKAAKIGREKYGEKIAELTEFFENPYPDENRGWTEFLTEWAWNLLTFDGSVFYPRYTLGGKLMGFDIIDPSTIKILLDNYGRVPVPPAPAYQQILWGFPRGEFVASPMSEVDGEYYEGGVDKNIRPTDSLAYFVRNRRTWTPYGFSEVEQAIPAATLYLERQNWLVAEYQAGSMPQMFMETDAQNEITALQLAEFERVFNDKIAGSTSERHRVKVLPAGFKPSQVMSVDEKYKADYDEWIVKKIASIFGIAPSQLGVVARAGLGGGKGAHEGEEQSAETVSAKPIEKFIVECVNSLAKRFLGMDNNLTFVLEDQSSAENEDMKAKAAQVTLFSGIATLNDVRGDMGLPLYDMPEADEPFIVAGNAIQFLKGQLAVDGLGETVGQKEQPLDQTTTQNQVGEAHPQGNEPQGQVNSNEGQKDGDTQAPSRSQAQAAGVKAAQTDELRDFAKFVKARHKRGNWRAFEFGAFADSTAEKLNEAGYFIAKGATELPENVYGYLLEVANLGDTPKGLVTKGSVEQTPGYDEKRKLENKHAPLIGKALAQNISGVQAAIAQALSQEHSGDANHIKSIVNLAVSQNIKTSPKKAIEALTNLYKDAIAEGQAKALTEVSVKKDATPGSFNTKDLLNNAGITLQGINDTTLTRISTAIQDGMSQGNSARDIGTAINQIINDPTRADMIAITETNRAYNAASIDTYQAAGLTEWEWVAYDEACDECSSQEGNHSIGDPYPPEHPNCRCGVSPVVDSLTDATSSQIDPEADAPLATDETDAQPADLLYSPILDKFPKVQPMSIEDAARGANPNYDVKPGYKTNCARVVQNYELRRRGYDVTANAFSNSDQNSFAYMNEVWENPLSPGKLTRGDWLLKLTYSQNVGSDSNIVFPDLVVKKSVKAYDRVSSFILGNHPEGSRGFLQMNWGSRSGHVINWEVQNGKVVFVDAQSNEIWAPTDSYWKSGSNWRVLRVDNLRPTDNIANYVEGK